MEGQLLGPVAALALALLVLGLFYTGKILSRSTVPREDYEKLMQVVADYAAALKEHAAATTEQTRAMDRLIMVVELQQRNGGTRVPPKKK